MELYYPLILDGATGTQLAKYGYNGDMSAELWSLEHPDRCVAMQKEFIDHGTEMILSPTFCANPVKLEENGVTGRTVEINARLTALAREAAGDKAHVAGDIGPTGKFIVPLGDLTFEEMVDIYKEQVLGLEEGGVDMYVIETMMTVAEARAALLAVRSISDKPVYVTFTCDKNGKTMMGTDVTAALVIFQGMGVDAFGLNCSVGPDDMLTQIRRLREFAEVPLVAKPNAGIPELIDGKTVYHCTPEEFTECIDGFAEAGVMLFGGCCGSTEKHIKAIYDATRNIRLVKPDPQHKELLKLATEKKVYLLPVNTIINQEDIIPCSESLEDLLELEADKTSPVTAIRISCEEELKNLEEHQISIIKPLCIVCDDESLLEKALRLYQGRAMYEGTLPKETLERLRKLYGLVY